MSSGDATFVSARLSVAYTDPLPCGVAAVAAFAAAVVVVVMARSSNPNNWNPAWHFSNNRTPNRCQIARYTDDPRLD